MYGAGLFLAYAVVLFTHSSPPSMTDYANWTYQGVLLQRHLLGFRDAAHVLKHYPVPNSAATLGIGLLALVFPWIVAAKLWLCVQMMISFLALRQLARTVQATAAVWFIVPQAVFLGVNWWYGFVNFELGLAWVMLMAALLWRRARGDDERAWALGLILMLAFFTHMIPFLFCGLLLILYVIRTRRWLTVWQLLPGALLSLWYVAGRYFVAGNADGSTGMISPVTTFSGAFWAFKVNSYAKSFGFVDPGDQDASVGLTLYGETLLLALVIIAGALTVLLGWEMVLAVRLGWRHDERFLWLGVLALVPVYVLAPGTAVGVSDPGSRILQTGLALALVLCCRQQGRLLKSAGFCSLVLAGSGLLLFARAGFDSAIPGSRLQRLPGVVVSFGHVPNHDQDSFYEALERGDLGVKVFPTGMFLNR